MFFKKRRIRKQLNERFQAKKVAKYIRNIERLKVWMSENNHKGVELIQNYLENEGMPPPNNAKECDTLIGVIKHVA